MDRMKIRIGFGLGTRTAANDSSTLGPLVDTLERLRFDSLWLSEQLTGRAPDPLMALAFTAGRTEHLKLGTAVLVVPGRNPVVLAKELASLDRLSDGRLLPAVGLGAPTPVEHKAFGVDRTERSAWFDEAIGLMRRLWTEDDVHHDGARFHVDGVTLRPKPVQQPIELWLGGTSASEVRRTGRMGDGWLPSFCTVDDVRDGIATINRVATEHDREIDPEHFGALIAYSASGVPEPVRAMLAVRRPELDPTDVVPVGLPAVRDRITEMVDAGASKFVVVPMDEPTDWTAQLEDIASELMPLQT
jgi:probable F420-dependent oxidoreductase